MIRSNTGLDELGINDVFIAGNFRVCPRDVTTHIGSNFMASARMGGGAPTPQFTSANLGLGAGFDVVGMPVLGVADHARVACPPPVLIWRAAALLLKACRSPGRSLEIQRIDRIRVLGASVLGEPITCVASVRSLAHSPAGLGASSGEESTATLDVELRRPGGGRCLGFELRVESRSQSAEAVAPVGPLAVMPGEGRIDHRATPALTLVAEGHSR